jgi:hypothetical protein
MAEEDFLSRWSRRKAEARRPAEPESEPALAAEAVEIPAEAEPPEPEPPAELPNPETLEAGSDFRVFMADGVPAALRRQALRRLWRVNPIINTLDGLDDYYVTQDFTDAATVVPDLKTVYRVGREVVAAVERVDGGLSQPEAEQPEAPQPTPAIATDADGQIEAPDPPQAIVSEFESL